MDDNHFTRRLDHETDCADLHDRLGAPHIIVLDARTREDHRRRRVPGSVSLPHREITSEVLADLAASTDGEVEFITYCWGPHCNGATKAAAKISTAGYLVREMLGGMWGWEQEGFRFEGDDVRVTVGMLTFDGMDLMDFAGPYEVFLTANRLTERAGVRAPFDVITLGEPVRAFGGVGIIPTQPVDGAGHLDVLVVPGAIDVDRSHPDGALRVLVARADVVASVCTGAFFLQRNQLLGDHPVTTHWEDVGSLRHHDVRSDVRWIDAGSVVTSGGISSGIAMAVHLVERFAGRALAEATARQIDDVWTEGR